MTLGGYPEVFSRSKAKRSAAWFDPYMCAKKHFHPPFMML
jgi:hypothetical protein